MPGSWSPERTWPRCWPNTSASSPSGASTVQTADPPEQKNDGGPNPQELGFGPPRCPETSQGRADIGRAHTVGLTCAGSGHRRQMSQDIGDTCRRSSATARLGSMLGHASRGWRPDDRFPWSRTSTCRSQCSVRALLRHMVACAGKARLSVQQRGLRLGRGPRCSSGSDGRRPQPSQTPVTPRPSLPRCSARWPK